jgi:hypothetical protein
VGEAEREQRLHRLGLGVAPGFIAQPIERVRVERAHHHARLVGFVARGAHRDQRVDELLAGLRVVPRAAQQQRHALVRLGAGR